MAETVKKGDFIEIDYVARIKSTNTIFDLTREDVAKEEGLYNPEQKTYKPMIVVLGENQLLRGLDEQLDGKEVGKDLEIEVLPEQGFGKRNPKLMQTIGLKLFKEKGINPVAGAQYALDGTIATIRSVNGGRVIIDFNHPLSGKILVYKIKITRIVKEAKEKVLALVELLFKNESLEYSESEKGILIKVKDFDKINPILVDGVKKQIAKLIPELKDKKIEFEKLSK